MASKLAEYGIQASNFFIDWDLNTAVILCTHVTSRMKLFMSQGNVSLGGVARDTILTAHRVKVGGVDFGLLVIYCKKCFENGARMLFGES
jgi:hypothetical protein